jgi:DNA-binding IclR family transcriptional regulator
MTAAPAVTRALDIFELLAASKIGLTLSDLSNALGVPKSSVHYLLNSLRNRGYVHRNETTKRFLLGLKILTLSNAALSGIELRREAAPYLRRLMEKSGLTVHLAVLEGDEAVLVERIEPPSAPRVATWIGKRMDLHCTGVGKAILAYLPDEDFDRMVREHGFTRYNENTLVSRRRLVEEVARIRKLGYALEDEEGEIGFRCIGCPIFNREGRITAAISVAGTTEEITPERGARLSAYVKETADAISECIGLSRKPVPADAGRSL